MFEIYENDIYDDIFPANPYLDTIENYCQKNLTTFYKNNIHRLFPFLRRGSHYKGILTIFTESTIEMMNSVGPAMACILESGGVQ